MNEVWKRWNKFCKETKREKYFAERIIEILKHEGLLPLNGLLLDCGCGGGEFTSRIQKYAERVIGIDEYDTREYKGFKFIQTKLEDYIEPCELLIFKQSFHHIKDSFTLLKKYYSQTPIVIIQMPKPRWAEEEYWNKIPFSPEENIKVLRQTRDVKHYSLKHKFKIDLGLLKEMFLEGYTSDLYKMSRERRESIYREQNTEYFQDDLEVIVAGPETEVIKHNII